MSVALADFSMGWNNNFNIYILAGRIKHNLLFVQGCDKIIDTFKIVFFIYLHSTANLIYMSEIIIR